MSHVHGGHAHDEATLGVHGMVLVGRGTLYLSHLPMFMAPHDFQVILEVSLDDDAMGRLRDSRASGPTGIYTFRPEEFHITELVSPEPGGSARTRFGGDLVRGHFEKGGQEIAEGTTVTVVDIAYFRQLDFDSKEAELTYVLFGKGDELFLAHRVTAAPDFDQVVSVHVQGLPDADVLRFVRKQVFADADRFDGLQVAFEGRKSSVQSRLRAGERSAARGHVTGRHGFLDLEVEVLSELYFEEGELAERATFQPTEEETAAGFGD